MDYVLLAVGILMLLKGACWLVKGASALAARLGVSKLAIGLTVVSLGTTLPELMISLFATARARGDVVFGNIIGSCTANILLILGLGALLTKLKVKFSTTWKEIPFAFLAALVLFVFYQRRLLDPGAGSDVLGRSDGIILLLFFAVFLYYVFELARKSGGGFFQQPVEERSGFSTMILLIAGGAGLYLGGEWTVVGAVGIAESLGLGEFLISATVVALGTSLPEFFTAVVAIKRGDVDLAVGNVLGSNVLNIFWILGLSSLISPLSFPAYIAPDLFFLLTATFLLFLFMFTSKKHELDKWEGVLFLAGYCIYIAYVILRG